MIVVLDAEDGTTVFSFIWTKHRNVMDGRTDRQPVAITAVCITAVKSKPKRMQTMLPFSYSGISKLLGLKFSG